MDAPQNKKLTHLYMFTSNGTEQKSSPGSNHKKLFFKIFPIFSKG